MDISAMKVVDPDSVKLTVTLTASLTEWKELKAELPTNFPTFKLREAIGDMVAQAGKHFYPKDAL